MKTALITGGTGFIGHNLANALDKKGYKVTVIDKAYNNYKELNPDVNYILQDIRTGGLSGEFDYVYHLAAKRSVTESFKNPQDYMSTNVWGTYNVVQSFPNSRIINVSSSAALENKSIYGITKKCGEHFANVHRDRINIRLMNVFGERQLEFDMAVPAFAWAIKNKKQAVIFGDGTIERDYTYVYDVVDDLIRIGESTRKGTTEIGYGKPITILALYKLMCKMTKTKEDFTFGPPRKGDMKRTCAKYKINEPRYGFTEGLRRTLKWYLKCKEF